MSALVLVARVYTPAGGFRALSSKKYNFENLELVRSHFGLPYIVMTVVFPEVPYMGIGNDRRSMLVHFSEATQQRKK